jgi:hypothetical protein
MMFTSPRWLIGAGFALEGMRRCLIGGTALALFIDLSGLEPPSAVRDVEFLRRYLEVEERLIQNIPPIIAFITSPFIDYHNANCVFLDICDQLQLSRRELTCAAIWEKGAG